MEKKKAPIIGLLLVIFLSLRQFSSTFVKKIKFQIVYQSYCKDHLHIRGENHRFQVVQVALYRITSTYVEKTSYLCRTAWKNQDHLHIRGENGDTMDLGNHLVGSPPHTWRKHIFAILTSFKNRITSTYVEKTGKWLMRQQIS